MCKNRKKHTIYITVLLHLLCYSITKEKDKLFQSTERCNVSIDETKYTPPLKAIHNVNGLFPFIRENLERFGDLK